MFLSSCVPPRYFKTINLYFIKLIKINNINNSGIVFNKEEI